MREILVVRRDSTLLPLGPDDEAELRELPQGKQLKAKITQPRSTPHNAFFHAFLQEVFDLWPKGHKFQPQSWEHLRAWLLCKVNHCRRKEVWVGDAELRVIRRVLAGLVEFHEDEDRFYWYWVQNEHVVFVRPLSLKYAEVDEDEFKVVSSAVFRVVFEATGLDADEHHRRWMEAHPERSKGKAGGKGSRAEQAV